MPSKPLSHPLVLNPSAQLPLALRLAADLDGRCPIGGLRLAAQNRLEEARILLDQKHFHGGAYLAGYAAEMALGYCYVRAGNPSRSLMDDAESFVLPAKRRAEAVPELSRFARKEVFRQGHSPLFWWSLFKWERERQGKPIPFRDAQKLDFAVSYIQSAWDVWLRYRAEGASRDDAFALVYRAQLIYDLSIKVQR